MTDTRFLPVPDGLVGERVDVALVRLLGLTRTAAADLASAGLVLINDRPASKSDRLPEGGRIEVTLAATKAKPLVVPELIDGITILCDDPDFVVIDKPVGVAAHPAVSWHGPTVLGHLIASGFDITTSGASERQGIVQRLDVGTTGVMVVAKSESGYSILKRAFKSRDVSKTYHALVQGHPDPLVGTIDAPIGRNPRAEYKFMVTEGGKRSITHYEVIEVLRGAALLDVKLETGRTHQIRVHMAATGHPCVGDPMYGADPTMAARLGLDRQWLHATELSFAHPRTGEWVTFTSPYPADLQSALDQRRAERW